MKAKEFIKKLNLSTFKGTICVSEKELERHLEEFGKQKGHEFYNWMHGFKVSREIFINDWNESEHEHTI